ncbi:hypothetical protein Zmor_012363 [Zophobas morio]|uniref:Uncharacterized protein n=1 Tax=Zophobas morio TaxID=2755281 RepID=A0AA38LZL9_9CUCU|nr:hypothetical protein Zmor_012363 [Zophobas morio]
MLDDIEKSRMTFPLSPTCATYWRVFSLSFSFFLYPCREKISERFAVDYLDLASHLPLETRGMLLSEALLGLSLLLTETALQKKRLLVSHLEEVLGGSGENISSTSRRVFRPDDRLPSQAHSAEFLKAQLSGRSVLAALRSLLHILFSDPYGHAIFFTSYIFAGATFKIATFRSCALMKRKKSL